jgi:hypothetical protein
MRFAKPFHTGIVISSPLRSRIVPIFPHREVLGEAPTGKRVGLPIQVGHPTLDPRKKSGAYTK